MNPLYKVLTISKIQEEVAGFKTFTFIQDAGNAIAYAPGQYLTLVLKKRNQEIRRSYSITSAPALGEPLTIGVKRIQNGLMSRYLVDKAQPGDQILTTGAGGFFILPADISTYKQIFFLAAGSGITPIYSLLKTVLQLYPAISVVLIYSNHSPATTAFRENLIQLAQAFPAQFRIEFLYSNAPDLARAHLHKDLLKSFLAQYSQAAPAELLCYVCGPLNYMRMCTYALREAALPAANIRKENFSTDKPTAPPLPPDTDQHMVTLDYRQRLYQLPVQYPTTILQAAKKAGISLPYSCEAGKCGNCVARCTAGQVWHSYNEVLTEKELNQGLILTCVGYPIGGDIRLII
ncbi:flavodoxin reductase [Adhaeribacter aerolatus]|uniref:Flavodoxin reductase n=1 Tax=Adhaeribacter aerolatus TaxID=670289 RepID=A0A512B0Y8_9BACT|nr:iron-sulfur cluster-binding domain-containing protein [Adhaeribacter aerolatus]GEO05628.1 flavodoxin reductase [Adhaeribacter aerolatus]